MYCRECGEQITNDKAVICIKCGTNKGEGDKYCPECGGVVKTKGAEVCLNCGVRIKGGTNNFTNKIKDVTNNSIDVQDKGKVALMIVIGGFVASFIPYIRAVSGIIVIVGAIMAMLHIYPSYKSSGNNGLAGYFKYVLNGMTGKDSSANKLACIAVFLGFILVVIILIGLLMGLGNKEAETEVIYFWTY